MNQEQTSQGIFISGLLILVKSEMRKDENYSNTSLFLCETVRIFYC